MRLFLTVVLLVGGPAKAADPLADLETYEYDARALVHAFERNAPRVALHAATRELLDLAARITPAFIERQPDCAAYLNAALTVRERWQKLDAETIERDFHEDGALPAAGTPPVCYHMKDLIVHPATVLVLIGADEPDLVQARREIDEAIAHIAAVRALM